MNLFQIMRRVNKFEMHIPWQPRIPIRKQEAVHRGCCFEVIPANFNTQIHKHLRSLGPPQCHVSQEIIITTIGAAYQWDLWKRGERVLWGKKQLGPVLKEQQNHKKSRRIGWWFRNGSMGLVNVPTNFPKKQAFMQVNMPFPMILWAFFFAPKILLEGSISHLCHRPWSIAEDGRHLRTFHVWVFRHGKPSIWIIVRSNGVVVYI